MYSLQPCQCVLSMDSCVGSTGEEGGAAVCIASNCVMRMRTENELLSRFHGEKKEELLGVASNHVMWNHTEYRLLSRFHGEKKEELLGVSCACVLSIWTAV